MHAETLCLTTTDINPEARSPQRKAAQSPARPLKKQV